MWLREEHTEGQGELDDGACVLSRGMRAKYCDSSARPKGVEGDFN